MRPLRLGILGTGIAARKLYLPQLRKLRGRITVVACANRTRAKAEALARDFGIPRVFGSARELLQCPEVEAVALGLPIPELPRHVLMALKAGKHVLSEKPVAPSVAEGKSLLRAAAPFQRRGLKWLVGENYHFLESAVRMKSWVDQGLLGKIRLVEVKQTGVSDQSNPYVQTRWRRSPRFVGFVVDAGVHLAHVVRVCLGPPEEMRSLTAAFNPLLPPLDTALAVMRFRNGALGTWMSCFSASAAGPMVALHGTKADAELHPDRAVFRPHAGKPRDYFLKVDSFRHQFRHFAEAVVLDRPLAFSPKDALQDLAMVESLASPPPSRPRP